MDKQTVELVRAFGSDGKEYSVQAAHWDLEKVEKCWDRIAKFGIFSDNLPKSAMGFLQFVLSTQALWFELVDLGENKTVGLMYLTEVIAGVDNRFVEASWHAMVWDAKAGARRPVFRAAIKQLFQQFGFHRLRAEIPLKFGGTIRQAKRIGFVQEGVIRESAMYNGIWFNSLVMSILEKEAAVWEV